MAKGTGLAVLTLLAATGCGRYTFQPVEDKDTAIKQLHHSLDLEGTTLGEWTDKTFSEASRNAISATDGTTTYKIQEEQVEMTGRTIFGENFDLETSALGRMNAMNVQIDEFRSLFKNHILGIAAENTNSQALDVYKPSGAAVDRTVLNLIETLSKSITKKDRTKLNEASVKTGGDSQKTVDEVVRFNEESLKEIARLSQVAAWATFVEGGLREVNVYNRLTATIVKSIEGKDVYAEGQKAKTKVWSTAEKQREYQDKLDKIASLSGGSYTQRSLDEVCQGPMFDILKEAQLAHKNGTITRDELVGLAYQIMHDSTARWYETDPESFDVTKIKLGEKTGNEESVLGHVQYFTPFTFLYYSGWLASSEHFVPKSTNALGALRETIEEGGFQMFGFGNSSYIKGRESELEYSFFGNMAFTLVVFPYFFG